MSKIHLEFDGDTEQDVATLALNCVSYWSEVEEIRQKLRDHVKYEVKTNLGEIYDLLCELQERYPLR